MLVFDEIKRLTELFYKSYIYMSVFFLKRSDCIFCLKIYSKKAFDNKNYINSSFVFAFKLLQCNICQIFYC